MFFRDIRNLLGNDQVYFAGKAITQQPAPLFSALHIRSSSTFVNVETYQIPIGIKRHRILILPDVVFKIVVMLCLIEVANINTDTVMTLWTRFLVPDSF